MSAAPDRDDALAAINQEHIAGAMIKIHAPATGRAAVDAPASRAMS